MKDYLSHQPEEPQLSGKLANYPEVDAILEDYRRRNANRPNPKDEAREDTEKPVTTDIDVTSGEAN
jgi:hypothetical protein